MKKIYLYKVTYLDDREGNLCKTEVEATDENDAYDKVSEDYYFGKLVSIEKQYEVNIT